jgi:hypothetical protein
VQPGNRQVIAAIDLHLNAPETVNAAKPRGPKLPLPAEFRQYVS